MIDSQSEQVDIKPEDVEVVDDRDLEPEEQKIDFYESFSEDEWRKQVAQQTANGEVEEGYVSCLSRQVSKGEVRSLFFPQGFHGKALSRKRDYFGLAEIGPIEAYTIISERKNEYRVAPGQLWFNRNGKISRIEFISCTDWANIKDIKKITIDLLLRIPEKSRPDRVDIIWGYDEFCNDPRQFLLFSAGQNNWLIRKKLPEGELANTFQRRREGIK